MSTSQNLIGKTISKLKKVKSLFKKPTPELFWAVEIETNSLCNRRCSYCPNSLYNRTKGGHLLPSKIFYKVIDELSELDFEGALMPHHYGEPLLDKRLEKLISYARKKLPHSSIEIYSNGDFLTQERFDSLVSSGVSLFRITNHDGLLPPHIEAILNDKKRSPKLIFHTINKLKMPLFNRGGLLKTPKTIVIDKCFIVNNLVIDYQGNVTLCCNDYLSKHRFGNVFTQKIKDIWYTPSYVKLRKDINQGIFNLTICQKCVSRG